jgi:hypothetical protein
MFEKGPKKDFYIGIKYIKRLKPANAEKGGFS